MPLDTIHYFNSQLVLPRQCLILGVFCHLLQGGINGSVHAGVDIAIQQRLAIRGPVTGNLFIGGGIHQPDVALTGPGEPPALHEAVLAVEPLVVLQQEGVIGGEFGAEHDAARYAG